MKLRCPLLRTLAFLLLLQAGDSAVTQAAQPASRQPLPQNVEKRDVTIFSDGVRMAGDLYLPKGIKPGEKLPAIVICAGTAGVKAGTGGRIGPIFAQNGYVVLAFDYRGWGDSDSKLITLEKQPRPDDKSEAQVKARAVRWQMDFADQAMDIRAAISFVAGEPNVDKDRIGIWGTSYGGGLVTWTAGNDPRVKCTVAQVPGMGGGRGPLATARAFGQLTKQARGEIEPVPFETGKFTGLMAVYAQMRVNPAKSIGYSAIEAAEKIKTPMLIIEAGKDELIKPAENGQRVADILKAHGTPVEYHLFEGMTHYGIYKEKFAEATKLELDWFNKHLKGDGHVTQGRSLW
jgi:dipeptidyl aminopeptidase/acylaminoacyl peptidase